MVLNDLPSPDLSSSYCSRLSSVRFVHSILFPLLILNACTVLNFTGRGFVEALLLPSEKGLKEETPFQVTVPADTVPVVPPLFP